MTSLTEVYEGGAGGADLRRLYLGVGLFLVGAILTVSGIVFGTSAGVASALGLGVFEARELAGICAGIGLPATFLGVVTVLPQAGLRLRAVAVSGSAVALAGVVAFTAVYPSQWYGMATDYTLPVVAIYFLGTITTFWCLFVAVANFKTRNDPGGTVRLEITKEGQTKVVEVSNDKLKQGLGGIGLLGATPDGSAETQTGGTAQSGGQPGGTAQTDGAGAVAAPGRPRQAPDIQDDAELLEDPRPEPRGDVYCGNCEHFSYLRTEEGLQPYCGLHTETMSDMDACDEWSPNN
ncbi:DUF7139 domain-containing protein [Natronomonas sp. EA1]|uniref:DUF7139 domain-containing protein n=1 Tax=Natronomonas sp. EA1 TaxID=3421655 RepID=UPI003EBD3381